VQSFPPRFARMGGDVYGQSNRVLCTHDFPKTARRCCAGRKGYRVLHADEEICLRHEVTASGSRASETSPRLVQELGGRVSLRV
jgi:hypothetical protein